MAYASDAQLKKGLTQMKSYTDTELAKKQDSETGKGLSTNDYTTAEKEKLADLENYDDTEVKGDITALKTKVLPVGGTAGQILAKKTGSDFDTEWVNKPQGEGESYDDTAIKNSIKALDVSVKAAQSDITDLQDAVDTLNGTGEGSVSKSVSDAIDGVLDGAPNTFDTLKEIADWISADETGTAALTAKVNKNTSSIAALDESVKAAQEEIITLGSGIVSLSLDKANKDELADVATSGSYDDLTDTPDEYTLPPATASTLGGVKAGSGLNVLADGTLVVTTPADGQTQTGATNVLSWNTTKKDIEYYAVGDESNKQYLGMPDFAGQIESAKESLESEVSYLVDTGVKNLLPNSTASINGITFITDADGFVTASSTNDTRGWKTVNLANASVALKAGKYLLRIEGKTAFTEGYAGISVFDASGNTITSQTSASGFELDKDVPFTLAADTTVYVTYKVGNGAYRFMLRPASITDSTYQAYSLSNAQITEELSDTGWQEITLNDGFTVDGGQGAKVRKKNGMVTVVFGIRASTAFGTSNIIPFNLPDAYKPSAPINFTAFAAVGTQMALIGYIPANSTNMNIRCMSGTATSAYGTVSYPV